jgi:hypothetical protein
VAGVCGDVLIDDESDLHEKIPSPKRYVGVRRKQSEIRKKK